MNKEPGLLATGSLTGHCCSWEGQKQLYPHHTEHPGSPSLRKGIHRARNVGDTDVDVHRGYVGIWSILNRVGLGWGWEEGVLKSVFVWSGRTLGDISTSLQETEPSASSVES